MSHNHEHCECNNILKRIFISLICFIGGLFYSQLFILAYLVSGFDILIKGVKNLFQKDFFDENFLMSIATVGAILIKEYPEAAMVMILYQIGEYLQDRAIDKSRASIAALMDIKPEFAIVNGEKISPEKVKIGDIVTVSSGEKIPLDGIITEGNASVDMSALTGESVPVNFSRGMEIYSGGVNLDGFLNIKVTKEYSQSTVQKILELIEASAEKKAKTENFITKFAKIYTPVVVIMAFFIAALPIFKDFAFSGAGFNLSHLWIERALTFLVISCPCALVLSIPLSFYAGIGAASSNGILVKGGNYLEQLSKIQTIVFDKTGTLTNGEFEVKEIISENKNLLELAGIAESFSSHPLALAIKKALGENIPKPEEYREYVGLGTEAVYNGHTIKAGSANFIGVEEKLQAGSAIYISFDNIYQGYIILSDTLKEDSKQTINKLQAYHIKTVMLTGDTSERAEKVRNLLGINEAYSELLPAEKVKKLEEIMSLGNAPVAFAGDGINDAPVIKRSDVGISMGGLGSDAAIEASDIVIMDDKPSKIINAIDISRKTMLIVRQNIAFAIGVKILFLILGAFGYMTMWGAVFADVGVTVITIFNALRIKKI